MKTIRAVCIRAPGGPEVLELVERPLRDPGAGEIRVRIRAAGVNRADVLQRLGRYPAPPGTVEDVPGLEYAGEVERVGEGVRRWKEGDRVMGIVAGGAMATHVLVHEREAMPVPAGLSLEQAAAIPEAFLTAWDALRQAAFRLGERVLIHAAASGVGSAAVQLVDVGGGVAVGTSRSREKLDRCRALGAREAVEVTDARFADRIAPVHVVLDTVGGSYARENVKALAPRGRWILIGLLGGATCELPLGAILEKRIHLIGTVLRPRPLEEKAALARAFAREVVPLFETGRLRPVVDAVLPLERVREAHERIERNETFGKIVLTP